MSGPYDPTYGQPSYGLTAQGEPAYGQPHVGQNPHAGSPPTAPYAGQNPQARPTYGQVPTSPGAVQPTPPPSTDATYPGTGYGVAPPLDQVFATARPVTRSGILTALGVFAMLASIAVPAALGLVVNLSVLGCEADGWAYPVCTDGTQGALGVGWPLAAMVVAFIASTRAIANARHRPVRACVWIAAVAVVLVLLLSSVPSAAGVPFFGW